MGQIRPVQSNSLLLYLCMFPLHCSYLDILYT